MRGSLCSHQKLSALAREWVSSEIILMPEHFFMVKGTCNECKCLGFPPEATEIPLFSAFPGVTQVLRWREHRNTLREGPYQAARRALSRTLHFNVSPLLLLELLSAFDHPCPSVTAFPSARRLPGCQGTSTKPPGFFSSQYLHIFVLDKKKPQNTDTLQPAHHIPSPVSAAFTVGVLFFWLPWVFLPGGQRCCCRNLNAPWHPAAVRGSMKGKKMFEKQGRAAPGR